MFRTKRAIISPIWTHMEAMDGTGTDTDSLPLLAKMSDLSALFDFERDKPEETLERTIPCLISKNAGYGLRTS